MLMANSPGSSKPIALVYLARGAETDHLSRFEFFLQSYRRFSAGAEHTLFVIYKGFNDDEQLRAARALFSVCQAIPIYTTDAAFDIGAYAEAIQQIPHGRVCFLNTNSEILCDGWLGKLAANLAQPRVGIVSATASFESLVLLDPRFPRFPNVHVRSNAFMMHRELAAKILPAFRINDKKDAFFAESGPEGITRRLFAMGMTALVVGRNGRGYAPASWPVSQTFRQGTQQNLLVHDNVTRSFEAMPWPDKKVMSQRSWGDFLQKDRMMVLPA
jgi:hypothetical protein